MEISANSLLERVRVLFERGELTENDLQKVLEFAKRLSEARQEANQHGEG